MAIYNGDKQIHELYNGDTYIEELYNGDTKIFDAGWNTQITGTSPLSLPNARAKSTSWKIEGQSSQSGTPTPTSPIEVKGVGDLSASNYVVPIKVSDGTNTTTYNINLPAPLQKIGTYKDSIESDGTLTRGVGKLVLTGTEPNWSGSSYFTVTLPGMATMTYGPGYCTHGKVDSSNDRIVQLGSNNNISYWCEKVKPEGVTDLATWIAYLAQQYANGTPVTVYYPLETEVESSIEVPTINTVKGQNYIDIETEIQPSNISMTYRKKQK